MKISRKDVLYGSVILVLVGLLSMTSYTNSTILNSYKPEAPKIVNREPVLFLETERKTEDIVSSLEEGEEIIRKFIRALNTRDCITQISLVEVTSSFYTEEERIEICSDDLVSEVHSIEIISIVKEGELFLAKIRFSGTDEYHIIQYEIRNSKIISIRTRE